MPNENSDNFSLKLLEKIHKDLIDVEAVCSDYDVKEKLLSIIDLIEKETSNNKVIFIDMIYSKLKETKGRNSDLNTRFYMLYRNIVEGKISMQEAQEMYDMYVKEIDNKWIL